MNKDQWKQAMRNLECCFSNIKIIEKAFSYEIRFDRNGAYDASLPWILRPNEELLEVPEFALAAYWSGAAYLFGLTGRNRKYRINLVNGTDPQWDADAVLYKSGKRADLFKFPMTFKFDHQEMLFKRFAHTGIVHGRRINLKKSRVAHKELKQLIQAGIAHLKIGGTCSVLNSRIGDELCAGNIKAIAAWLNGSEQKGWTIEARAESLAKAHEKQFMISRGAWIYDKEIDIGYGLHERKKPVRKTDENIYSNEALQRILVPDEQLDQPSTA
jgi:hypothetical protein